MVLRYATYQNFWLFADILEKRLQRVVLRLESRQFQEDVYFEKEACFLLIC